MAIKVFDGHTADMTLLLREKDIMQALQHEHMAVVIRPSKICYVPFRRQSTPRLSSDNSHHGGGQHARSCAIAFLPKRRADS